MDERDRSPSLEMGNSQDDMLREKHSVLVHRVEVIMMKAQEQYSSGEYEKSIRSTYAEPKQIANKHQWGREKKREWDRGA